MDVHAYHRARSKKNITIQPTKIRPPIVQTKASVAGSGSSRVGSMVESVVAGAAVLWKV
jgi:hypothetical protein